MNLMKAMLGGVVAASIMIPLRNAQAWDNNTTGGGSYYGRPGYSQNYRGYDGSGYSPRHRGYGNPHYAYQSRGYGPRGYRYGYYGPPRYHDHGSAGAVVAGLALGAIIGAAIIDSAPPPPVMPPPPLW